MMQKVMIHNQNHDSPLEVRDAMEFMIKNGYRIDHIATYGNTLFIVYSKEGDDNENT